MRKSIYPALIVALLGLMVLLAACTSQGENEAALKLGVIPVEDNFPFFVAEAEGMFTEAGLQVELFSFNSARDRDTALQAGEIDGAASDIVAAALLRKAGAPVKIVALTMGAKPEEGRFVLLAAPKSKVKQATDLRGVPVAVSQHTIIDYVNYRLLTGAGLKPEEIKTTNIPSIPERLQLLLANQVEAALLPDPLATLAEKQGTKVILDDTKEKENISQVVLLFREEAIKNKRASIARLLEVFGEASSRVGADPQKYRELFVEKARVPDELKDSYLTPHYSEPSLPTEAEVQAVLDWMVAGGLISKPFKYGELVDSQFVR